MSNKEFFKLVNGIAQVNFDRAKGMLEAFNLLNETEFFFLNKRVCYGTYASAHDAWVNA